MKILYFGDPICSTCWGIEPQFRKFKLEYGHVIDFEYHMGGLLKSWKKFKRGSISAPLDVAPYWEQRTRIDQMPMDGDVWIEDPLHSSYPPSIAFVAAQLQNQNASLLYLRRLREMVFLEKKNIARWGYLSQAAKETGINLVQLKQDYDGKAKDLFAKDLRLAREYKVKELPTLVFINKKGKTESVSGYISYKQMVDTLIKLNGPTEKKIYPKDELTLFENYPALTTKEFATLKGISYRQAEIILHKYEAANKTKSRRSKNGKLWFKAQYAKNDIAIIGGGVAGLAFANLLEKKGIDYNLYERQPNLKKRGHGFIIPEEGLEILSEIMKIDDLLASGNNLNLYQSYNHKGELITKAVLDNTFVISRVRLLDKLLKAIPKNKVHFNKEFEEMHVGNSIVKNISFHDYSIVNPSMIVASDGIKSKVRTELFPKSRLAPVPENEIVNIIDSPELAKTLGSTFRKIHHEDGGLALGMIKISAKKVLWFVQFDTNKFKLEFAVSRDLQAFMKRYFTGWPDPIPYLIKQTDFSKSHVWKVFELEKLENYYKGNSIIIGDAAHPLIPLTSQGVTSAIKDAKVLADLIEKNNDTEHIFREFSERRMSDIQKHIRQGKFLLQNFLLPLNQQIEDLVPISTK